MVDDPGRTSTAAGAGWSQLLDGGSPLAEVALNLLCSCSEGAISRLTFARRSYTGLWSSRNLRRSQSAVARALKPLFARTISRFAAWPAPTLAGQVRFRRATSQPAKSSGFACLWALPSEWPLQLAVQTPGQQPDQPPGRPGANWNLTPVA